VTTPTATRATGGGRACLGVLRANPPNTVSHADTVALLSEQAQHFGGTVEELAARRDQAIIQLIRTLREIPASAAK